MEWYYPMGMYPLPSLVVSGRWVQHNRHEGPYVVHSGGLSVESCDVVDVESRGEGGLRRDRRNLKGDWRMAEDEALCGGHLGSQGSANGTILLLNEGRGALLRGSHGGLDGGNGGDQCRDGGGRQGSLGAVGNERAHGGEARGRVPGEACR
jgi:hypothetical protein